MFEWHRTIQEMIDIVEKELVNGYDDEITLTALARELGYSKYHVTKRFSNLTGMTFRNYLRLRKLAFSAIELRDTDRRILDVAIKYGFSSQEAYTRAFKKEYGITPNGYRTRTVPLKLQAKPNTFDPYYLGIGESSMSKTELRDVTTDVVTLPAHKFLHIKNLDANNYFGFWALQDKIPGQDCETICGLLDSIGEKLDSVTGKIGEFDGQIGAFFDYGEGAKGYAYGIRLPYAYSGELPRQMECIDVPQRLYMVFSHSPFAYDKIGSSVVGAVKDCFSNYDFSAKGYEQEKKAMSYEIHNPEHVGYRLFVPVRG